MQVRWFCAKPKERLGATIKIHSPSLLVLTLGIVVHVLLHHRDDEFPLEMLRRKTEIETSP